MYQHCLLMAMIMRSNRKWYYKQLFMCKAPLETGPSTNTDRILSVVCELWWVISVTFHSIMPKLYYRPNVILTQITLLFLTPILTPNRSNTYHHTSQRFCEISATFVNLIQLEASPLFCLSNILDSLALRCASNFSAQFPYLHIAQRAHFFYSSQDAQDSQPLVLGRRCTFNLCHIQDIVSSAPTNIQKTIELESRAFGCIIYI